jgi:metal-responsive CopG/Arc/MetJ family transcriptional regulator
VRLPLRSLPESDLREADKLSKALRLSRSALIRLLVLEYLKDKRPKSG